MFFFLFFNSVLSDCDFKKTNTFANTLKSIGGKASTVFAGKFGFGQPANSLGESLDNNKVVDYIVGNVGLGAIMLVIFVLFILYFLIGSCAFCCCCRPQESEKCKFCSFSTICHIITTALLACSIVFFFMSCTSISGGIDETADIPGVASSSLTDVVNKIDSAATSTLDTVNDTIKQADKQITEYISFLEDGTNTQKTNADTAKASMTSYDESFFTYTSDPDTYFTGCGNKDYIKAMITDGYTKIKANIDNAIDTTITKQGEMTTTINDAKKNQEENLKEVDQQLRKTRKNNIDPMINDLRKVSKDVDNAASPITDKLKPVKKYTRIVIIIATAIYSLLVILLALAYFFNSCCSRCLVCCDWCLFLIIDFFIILPGAIFGVVYFVFYDACPNLETTFSSLLGSSLPFQKSELKNVLLCEEEKSLYSMANMTKFLDIDKFKKDIEDSVKDTSVEIDTGSLESDFNNFGNGLTVNDITEAIMWPGYEDLLKSSGGDSDTCPTRKSTFLAAINNDVNKNELKKVRENMASVIEFGNKVKPNTESLKKNVNSIQVKIPSIAIDKLKEGINTITCKLTKCMYSSIKNPVCATLLNGFGEWIISSILAIIGIFIWSIIFICRRKKMAPLNDGDSPSASRSSSSSSSGSRSSSYSESNL